MRLSLYRTNYHSATGFKERIEQYIGFYNTKRPHSILGYKLLTVMKSSFTRWVVENRIGIEGSESIVLKIYY